MAANWQCLAVFIAIHRGREVACYITVAIAGNSRFQLSLIGCVPPGALVGYFAGKIPRDLNKLQHLTQLALSWNILTGEEHKIRHCGRGTLTAPPK